jgi:hypothetical protein
MKMRCDGGVPCSLCTKRNTACTLDRSDISETHAPNDVLVYGITEFSSDSNHQGALTIDTNLDLTASGKKQTSAAEDQSESLSDEVLLENQLNGAECEIVDYSSLLMMPFDQIQEPSVDISSSTSDEPSFALHFGEGAVFLGSNKSLPGPVRSLPDSVTNEYYELYVVHFHHRWPIIHIPKFEKGDDPYVLKASVQMIGAWLYGTGPSRSVALTLHDRLSSHLIQKFV